MIVIIQELKSEGLYEGGGVFLGICENNQVHRLVANTTVLPRRPLVGEVWEVEGDPRVHSRYGLQIHLTRAVLKRPKGQFFIKTVTMSDRFPDIGSATATALYSMYGDDIYDLLEQGDPAVFDTIHEHEALTLINGWKGIAGTADVYKWLDKHVIKVSLAHKLLDMYGNGAAQYLDENPYRIMAFTSWITADQIAKNMGIKRNDPRRLVAAVDEAVYAELKGDNTWTSFVDFRQRIKNVLWQSCDNKTAEDALELAKVENSVIEANGGIQGIGPWGMENFIVDRIKEMQGAEWVPVQQGIRTDFSPKELDHFLCEFEQDNNITLNAYQKEAVKLANSSPVSIMCGGAGVGKTTALKAISAATEKAGGQMIFLALAGRAARRMTEATGKEAMTIARFLNHIKCEKISLEGGQATIAIDESSMIDLATMYDVVRLLEPGCRLLLVGDPGQLPPVSFGLSFHLLAKSDLIPRVELAEIMRQAASTGIPQFSVAIRDDHPLGADRPIPNIAEYSGKQDGVYFLECSQEGLHNRLLCIVKSLADGSPIAAFDKIRIISPLKGEQRPDGARAINELMTKELAQGKHPEKEGWCLFEPVIYTENDYNLDLRNGTLGYISGVSKGIEISWENTVLTMDTMYSVERAYAINCHRCQGSQFERVIIPVYASKILDSTMIYTAVTRAQRQVILVGDREAFRNAVLTPPNSSLRKTGFQFLLPGFCGNARITRRRPQPDNELRSDQDRKQLQLIRRG